jgi:EAL domain-containing protein (putative c-di-GMP-specific phosphodiesterase class I)
MAVVKAIVGLAEGLDLKVVAEGIETKEQAEALRALHCVYGQGYRFARPMSTDQVMSSIAGEATKARSAG